MNPYLIVIGGVFRKNSPKVLCVEHDQMIRALAPIEPIKRSAYPFCHGERNDVGRSRMPIARTRALNATPTRLSDCGAPQPQQLSPAMAENKKRA